MAKIDIEIKTLEVTNGRTKYLRVVVAVEVT